PIQEKSSTKLLQFLLQDPRNFESHIRHMTGAIIMKLTYSYDVVETEQGDDPFIELAKRTVAEFCAAATVGAFLVDIIPWSEFIPAWFPGGRFKRIAAEWRKDMENMLDVPFEWTRRQLDSGSPSPSLVAMHLPDVKSSEEGVSLKMDSRQHYAMGEFTKYLFQTVSSTLSFFLCMCLNPSVQQKAQAEIDTLLICLVIGQDRLPIIADRGSLPYIEAVLKEVLRWGSIAPAGLPHLLIQDDNYNGYILPRGCIIITNIWAMTRDLKYFPNPESFRPERFLNDNL
ncbi:hypothetical protein M422DRAFT_152019, partial [Sphaerobolus stellatus SS14]